MGLPDTDGPDAPATESEIAASEEIYGEATAGEARDLLQQRFSEELLALDQLPGRAFAGADVERFFSDTVARVDIPGGRGPQIVVSSSPLRDQTEGGAVSPIDLGIEPEGGHYEAENPLADVSLPANAVGEIRLQDANVGIRLESANGAQAVGTQLDGDKLFYHDAAPATDLILAPVAQGAEMLAQIRSTDSPGSVSFEVDLPTGAELRTVGGEGLEVFRGDERIALVNAPVATDAQGASVPSRLLQTGPTSFDLVVEHHSSATLYPVLVDPLFEDWQTNSWSGGGNGNFDGWSSYGSSAYIPNTLWCRWYCWGSGIGLYLHADYGWDSPAGVFNEWYYQVPGYTTFIDTATFYPIYFARGGENGWVTPYAFWGLWSDQGWTGYNTVGVGTTGAAQTFYPPTPPSHGASKLAVFGMQSSYGRTLQAHHAAALGGMFISIDDPEAPAISEPVNSPGAPALGSWLPEGNGVDAYKNEVLADNPMLYWRLGETSGLTAADTSNHGRSGTYVNSPSLGTHAVVAEAENQAGAIDLNGVDQFVYSPGFNPFVNGTTRTFEGWANRDPNNTYNMLIAGTTSDDSAPYMHVQGNDVFWGPHGNTGYPPWTGSIWSNAWPGTGQWVHWALVFDEAADRAELFINGESKGVKTLTTSYPSSPGTLLAGTLYWQSAYSGPFDGKLDEIAVYDHALSPARIRTHYRKAQSGIGWVRATASDPGVGVQSFKLSYTAESGAQVSLPATNVEPCQGTRQTSTCYESWGADFPYNGYSPSTGPLPEGISALTLTATDALAKSGTRTFDAKVDRSTPAMQLSGGLFSPTKPGYGLEVAATDGSAGSHSAADRPSARSGMKRIDLYIDRATNPTPLATTGSQSCTDPWGSCPLSLNFSTFNPAAYADGPHHFEVIATDQLGHERSKEWDEFVDNSPPTVTSISGPATEDWLTDGTTSISVTARNAGTGVQKIALDLPGVAGVQHLEHTFTCDPECPQAPTANWNIPVSQLAEGTGTLTGKAYGPGGIAGSPLNGNVRVDRTPATVEADGPSGWLSAGTSFITVSAENPAAGIDHITLDLPSGEQLSHSFNCSSECPEQASYEFAFDVVPLPNGVGDGIARAYGPGGASSAPASGPVKVDHSPPDLTATGSLFGSPGQLVGADATPTVDVQDQGSGVSTVTTVLDGEEIDTQTLAEFDNEAQTCEGPTCNFHAEHWVDLSTIAPGEHTVELLVADVAGQTDTATNYFTLDPTQPTLDVSGELSDLDGLPIPGDTASGTLVAGDTAEGDSGVATLIAEVDGQEAQAYTSICSPQCPDQMIEVFEYVKGNYQPGPHSVWFTATDAAGNQARAAVAVDVPAPDVSPPACPTEPPVSEVPVDPLPAHEAAQAIAAESGSLLAPNEPAVDPTSGNELDPILVSPDPGTTTEEPNIGVAGSRIAESTSTAPAGGFTVGETLCLRPAITTSAESVAFLTPTGDDPSVAAVYANSAPQTDFVYRPTPAGAVLVENLRGDLAPETLRWNVALNPGERLEELSTGGVAVVDTTVPDVPDCDVPSAPAGGEDFASLNDVAVQLAQSERDLCIADNEVDDGVVEAVIAPPVAVDEAGDPVPVTIEAVQIPDVPPHFEIDIPHSSHQHPVRLRARASAKNPAAHCKITSGNPYMAGGRANAKTTMACGGTIGTYEVTGCVQRKSGAPWLNLRGTFGCTSSGFVSGPRYGGPPNVLAHAWGSFCAPLSPASSVRYRNYYLFYATANGPAPPTFNKDPYGQRHLPVSCETR